MKVSISPSAVQSYLSQNVSKLRPTTTLIISSAPPPSPPLPSSSNTKSSASKTDHPLQKFYNQISTHTKSISFFTSMQHNLKTVQYGNETLISSFPILQQMNQMDDFIRRTMGGSSSSGSSSSSSSSSNNDGSVGVGDNTIIGVGNGAAIDLAKFCYLKNKNGGGQLVLIPSTLGSLLACTSKQSLILDIHEESLVTSSTSTESGSSTASSMSMSRSYHNNDNINVLVDEKSMAIPSWLKPSSVRNNPRGKIPTIVDAVLASLVIALDARLTIQMMDIDHDHDGDDHDHDEQQRQIWDAINQSINMAVSCLQQIVPVYHTTQDDNHNNNNNNNNNVLINQKMKQDAIQAVLNAGQLLSFGDDDDSHNQSDNDYHMRRNIALAFSSALLPKYFPHGNWMTFTASLLPGVIWGMDDIGMYHTTTNNNNTNNNTNTIGVNEDTVKSLEWIKEELLQHNNNMIPSLSSLADGAPDINELSQQVDDNGAFLNCIDCDSDFMEHVLRVSLNR